MKIVFGYESGLAGLHGLGNGCGVCGFCVKWGSTPVTDRLDLVRVRR